MRRPAVLLTGTILLATLALTPATAGADIDDTRDRIDNTRDARDQARERRARAASQIDALEADQAEVSAALQTLNEDVAAEESRLADAERAVEAAEQRMQQAQDGLEDTARRVRALRAEMADYAVNAYVTPRTSALSTVLGSDDANQAATRDAILSLSSARDADIVDRYGRLKAELETQRRIADEAREQAEQKRAEAEEAIASLEQARGRQRAVAARVQNRIDNQVARAVELAQRDKDLSARIALEQAKLQAQLEAQRKAEERARRRAAERRAAARRAAERRAAAERAARQAAAEEAAEQQAAARAAAEEQAAQEAAAQEAEDAAADQAAAAEETEAQAADYGSGGSEPAPVAGPGPVSNAGGNLCTVGGITVSCSISGQLQSLLSSASADGLSLSGSGYRDPSRQVELRRQHCGSSHYAIYEMSSSACSPPTAPPGSSQHEVGLAIDFSNCQSRGSSCYQWLAGSASRFGFYNLPSEPWHWSINGN